MIALQKKGTAAIPKINAIGLASEIHNFWDNNFLK